MMYCNTMKFIYSQHKHYSSSLELPAILMLSFCKLSETVDKSNARHWPTQNCGVYHCLEKSDLKLYRTAWPVDISLLCMCQKQMECAHAPSSSLMHDRIYAILIVHWTTKQGISIPGNSRFEIEAPGQDICDIHCPLDQIGYFKSQVIPNLKSRCFCV